MWFVVQDFTNEYISVLLLIISFIKHFCNYESNIFSLLKMWKIIKKGKFKLCTFLSPKYDHC